MKVITKHPIAYDSPDHLYPNGTKHDNTTNVGFIEEIERYFQNERISFLDIGCSGGQLVVDFLRRDHIAVGLEGSDYSVKHYRANWPTHYNTSLFNCDATKPYTVVDGDGQKQLFDCITAWEVIEHIAPNQLNDFFENIASHMHEKSIFVGSISLVGALGPIDHADWHQSIFPKEVWINEILNKHFVVSDYPFKNKVRTEETSFWVKLTKRSKE